MSLYRHIRDKDDLLDEVVERLLVGAWEPSSPTEDWRAWVTEAADKLRALLVAEPAALYVYLRHPVVSPVAIQRMKAIMGVLRQAGLDEPAARRAYAALHTYTVGFAALEASRAGVDASGGPCQQRGQATCGVHYSPSVHRGPPVPPRRHRAQGRRALAGATSTGTAPSSWVMNSKESSTHLLVSRNSKGAKAPDARRTSPSGVADRHAYDRATNRGPAKTARRSCRPPPRH